MNNQTKWLTIVLAVSVAVAVASSVPAAIDTYDHDYAEYAQLLERHVQPSGVDYPALKADRVSLDRVVRQFDAPPTRDEPGWPRLQRLAFWINAYNLFTLRAIVDHFPIQSGWFTRLPRNSIRQVDGVWTDLEWRAAGRTVTLDDIEHRILRPEFKDARIHFAINCASVSCPVLAAVPYLPASLDAQLDAAIRTHLAGPEGVRVEGTTLRVTSLFKWYGDDFIAEYAAVVPDPRSANERAILGTIIRYGPPDAVAVARGSAPRIRFLDYNWQLNQAR